MSVTAIVDRTSKHFNSSELLQIFHDCKARYGDDLGLMFMAMHLESEERIAELELKVAKLEAAKRK
jgi:hypothetical protein